MHIGKNQAHMDYSLKKDTYIPLEVIVNERDLGVHVDPSLIFNKHVEPAVNKANRFGLIRRAYTYMDDNSLVKSFTGLIRPILEYANVAWPPILKHDQELLENVQRRATKLVPKIKHLSYTDRLRVLKLVPKIKHLSYTDRPRVLKLVPKIKHLSYTDRLRVLKLVPKIKHRSYTDRLRVLKLVPKIKHLSYTDRLRVLKLVPKIKYLSYTDRLRVLKLVPKIKYLSYTDRPRVLKLPSPFYRRALQCGPYATRTWDVNKYKMPQQKTSRKRDVQIDSDETSLDTRLYIDGTLSETVVSAPYLNSFKTRLDKTRTGAHTGMNKTRTSLPCTQTYVKID